MIPTALAPRKRLISYLAVAGFLFCPLVRALEWTQPTEEELTATVSQIDADAGAEILYYVKEIDGTLGTTSVSEYRRIKVFSDKGVGQLAKVDVSYPSNLRIVKLEARVIKPDGTIINVDKKSFYERNAVTAGSTTVNVRSFSFPRLEPGDIAEYKYETHGYYYYREYTFNFASELPTRHALFRLKAEAYTAGHQIAAYYYLCEDRRIQRAGDGYYYIEMKNLPAREREPHMPPADDCEPWLVFYERETGLKDLEYWKRRMLRRGSHVDEHAKKHGRLVRATATEITKNKSTTGEKLDAINDYCREQILNFQEFTPEGGLDESIRKKNDRDPGDLMTSKLGGSFDIQTLFIALARAVGIDARPAYASSRSAGAFKANLRLAGRLPNNLVAVEIDGEWKYYQPASRLVDTGWLHWLAESEVVVIVLKKDIKWTLTPKHGASDSVSKRKAKLKLDEDGTLTGDVNIDYSGHCATEARAWFYLQSDEAMEKHIREGLEGRLSGVEVTDIRVPNAQDCMKPLSVMYKIRVPGYAERTGQRLFVAPGFFTKGINAAFVEKTRRHDIYFGYSMTLEDDVEITLPDGFQIEAGSAPQSMETNSWGKYVATLGFRKSTGTLLYKRHFSFSPVLIPANAYPTVKRIFDFVHAQDAHLLTLRSGD